MYRKARGLGSILLAITMTAALGWVGCGDPEEEARLAAEQAQAEAWAGVQEAQAALNASRQKLADVGKQIAAAAEEGSEATQEEVAQWQDNVKDLGNDVADASQNFNSTLAEFINNAGVVEGKEPPENVKAALRMKSDEDILIAREYIEKGGDYSRAIEIYETAQKTDPDYQKLADEIAMAQEMRWMSKERFDQAKNGMTRDEVRALLGQVNSRMIQPYPDRNVIAWFYPKGAEEGAAGVYFQKKGEGDYKVYKVDFNAVKTKAQTPAEPAS